MGTADNTNGSMFAVTQAPRTALTSSTANHGATTTLATMATGISTAQATTPTTPSATGNSSASTPGQHLALATASSGSMSVTMAHTPTAHTTMFAITRTGMEPAHTVIGYGTALRLTILTAPTSISARLRTPTVDATNMLILKYVATIAPRQTAHTSTTALTLTAMAAACTEIGHGHALRIALHTISASSTADSMAHALTAPGSTLAALSVPPLRSLASPPS